MWKKTTRGFVTEGTQLGSQVVETSLVTSYILSGDEHENKDAGSNKEPSVWLAKQKFRFFTTKREL
jgi:hypothetical protein